MQRSAHVAAFIRDGFLKHNSLFKQYLRGLFLLSLLLGAACSDRPLTDKIAAPAVIQDLSALKLIDLDGGHITLKSLRGRLLVMNIWATWCEPCRRELPSLQALAQILGTEKFAVFGVSIDEDVLLIRQYMQEKKIRLQSYIDKDLYISEDVLGVIVYPDTYIISPQGKLVMHFKGEYDWQQTQMVAALREAYHGDYQLLNSLR